MLQQIRFSNMLTRHAGIPATEAAIHPREHTHSGQISFSCSCPPPIFFFFLHQHFIQFATCHWIKVRRFPTTKQSPPGALKQILAISCNVNCRILAARPQNSNYLLIWNVAIALFGHPKEKLKHLVGLVHNIGTVCSSQKGPLYAFPPG